MDRRKLLQAGLMTAVAGIVTGLNNGARAQLVMPNGQASVMGLTVSAMDVVRVGFIGVGERGTSQIKLMCNIDGVEIKAIADPHQTVLDRSMKIVSDHSLPVPTAYSNGDYDYRKMLDRDDIDLVIISTPWRWHTPMAVEAMESGKRFS